MTRRRIALATSAAYPRLAPDDRLVLAPLGARDVCAEPAVWDDPSVRWEAYDAVVVRSCWDYHLRPDAFAGWVGRLTALGVPLWNPPATLHWNARKTYLRDLARAGVGTVPTAWVDASCDDTLAALLAARGWAEAVVKPVVSASAHRTWRVTAADAPAHEAEFRAALAHGDAMVQPYLDAVAADGEWSLVFLGGAFSHAALKRPRAGDFRVQAEHGGSAEPATPSLGIVAQAESIVRRFAAGCVYARVDGVVTDDTLRLMELELVEPSLFLGLHPDAPGRFARAIADVL